MLSPTQNVVISAHGIRTRGVWQKTLSAVLSDHQFSTRPFDYGHFGLLRFLNKGDRRRMVEQFYDFYQQVVLEWRGQGSDNTWRPSIVAHSFGSYMLGYCMLKYREVLFDKVILCGSILPVDFNWGTILGRGQVRQVRNQYGTEDVWSRVVGRVLHDCGPSGVKGFDFDAANFVQERFEYFEHSDYFRRFHIENSWIPVLQEQLPTVVVQDGRVVKDHTRMSDLLNKCHQIDLDCYGTQIDYTEDDLPRGLALSWTNVNPDIYTFLLDEKSDEVLGYINAMPLDDGVFERIKQGELTSAKQIDIGDVMPFRSHKSLRIYLVSIAVAPKARNSPGLYNQPLEMLLLGLGQKLLMYALTHKIVVSELLAIAWTAEGRRLCRMLGMKEVARDKFDNPVYELNLTGSAIDNRAIRAFGLRKLLEAYREITTGKADVS